MPELPEVEFAATRLREAVVGRVIARIDVLHPSPRRHLPPAARRAAAGQAIVRVERRAKIQLIHLADGAVLEVHFRMTGDWAFSRVGDPPPRFERVRIETTDGVCVSLVDSRAFGLMRRHPPGALVLPPIGPEPLTDDFTVAAFHTALARRRGPIKPALLDQKLVAGIGNIYASEALWEARISPSAPAHTVSRARVERLRDAIRLVLERAPAARYYARDGAPADGEPADDAWRVYGRDGHGCHRCAGTVTRLAQAGRSTFYCGRCQRR
jgi:formamidopyrimidine-DNA glycosylase